MKAFHLPSVLLSLILLTSSPEIAAFNAESLGFSSCISLDTCQLDVVGEISVEGEQDTFCLFFEAGDDLRVQMNFSAWFHRERIDFWSPGGLLLESVTTTQSEMAVLNYSINETGEYTFVVSELSGNIAGLYGFSFQLLNDLSCAIPVDCNFDTTANIQYFGEMDAYRVELETGDSLRIHMNCEGGSPFEQIELFSSNGALLKKVITGDAELGVLTYPISMTDTYLILLSVPEGDGVDDYGLSVQVTNDYNCTTPPLGCATDTSGTIALDAEMDAYQIDLSNGDSLRIQMNFTDAFDHERIDLYGPTGELLSTVITDDFELGILRYSIVQTGSYLIVLSEAEGDDTGSYGFSVQLVNAVACALPLGCATDTSGTIALDAEMDAYQIDLSNGDSLRIQMNFTDAFDHERIDLYGPTGELLSTVITDDFELGILRYSIVQTGSYLIVLSEAEGDDTGSYGFSVQVWNKIECIVPVGCELDTTWTISLDAEMDAYSVFLNAGTTLDLMMDFVSLFDHEQIELFDPQGKLLEVVSTGDSETAELSYAISSSGTYFIILTEAEGDDTGAYVFTVRINGALADFSSPDPQITSSDLSICPGESTTLESDPWASYQWSTGAQTQTIEVFDPGIYSVTVSNVYGCTGSDAETVIEEDTGNCDQIDTCYVDDLKEINPLGDVDTIALELAAGDSLRVRMNFLSNIDHEQIKLYGPEGTLLKTVTTGSFELAELSWPVMVTGTYLLVLSEAEGDDTGVYGLSVKVVNDPSCGELIDCTTDLQDSLSFITQMKTYRIELESGDSLRIHMNFLSDIDHERIDLYSPEGVLLKTVTTGSFELAFLSWPVTVSGTYFLVLSEVEGDDTGSFDLSVEIVNDPTCAELVDCTTDLQDSLSFITQMKTYRIELESGDSLRIHMNFLSDIDHERIDLYSPEGVLLKTVTTGSFELAFLSWPVTVSGTYFLVLSEVEGDDTGSFDLSVEIVNDPTCAELVDCTTDLQDSLSFITQMKTYRIELESGDSLRIHMNFLSDIDHERIDLYSPEGVLLKTVTTGSFELAFLSWPVTVSGTYFLVLSEVEGDDTGSFDLSVEIVNDPTCAELVDCTIDLQDSLSFITQMKTYRIELESGDSLRIHMNFLSDIDHERIDLYSPEGVLLKTVTTGSFELAVLSWPVAVSGTYFLELSEAEGDDTGSFDLSVEIVNDPTCAELVDCTIDLQDSLSFITQMKTYRIELESGDSLRVHMNFLSDIDHERIDLYAPNGVLLKTVTTGSFELAVLSWPVTVSGTYFLVLSEVEGDDTGSFGLSVKVVNDKTCTNPAGCSGDTLGEIQLFAQMKAYSIDLADGDELLLQMDFLSDIDHERIDLYSPDGELLQTVSTGSFEEALLSWTATQTGTFYIILSELEGDDTGEYVFTIGINGVLADFSSPDPQITSSDLSICPGESTTLDAGSWSSYDWNTGETTQIIQVNTPGTFSVTVSNNFGCSGEDEITISPTDSLACDTTIICPDTLATPTVVNDTVCAGEPAVLTAFGSTGVYRWYDAPSRRQPSF
jgi:hypothetical protein